MELLIKIYSNQASRIGIKYVYDYQAVKAYEQIIRDHKGRSFSAKIEPLKQKLNLVLQSDQNGKKIFYKDLLFKPDHLKKLNAAITPGMALEFVHLYSDANQLLIAKPFRKKEFITITKCDILGMEI